MKFLEEHLTLPNQARDVYKKMFALIQVLSKFTA